MDRVEAGARALFKFSGGYHPELTFDQLHPEHRAYLMASAQAVLEGADGAGAHESQRD